MDTQLHPISRSGIDTGKAIKANWSAWICHCKPGITRVLEGCAARANPGGGRGERVGEADNRVARDRANIRVGNFAFNNHIYFFFLFSLWNFLFSIFYFVLKLFSCFGDSSRYKGGAWNGRTGILFRPLPYCEYACYCYISGNSCDLQLLQLDNSSIYTHF